ncbi:Os11g0577675 [Oryza sativa Japonica Group]|uniref:Os11g0577675 protein n=1 Tax=Oryza sativa subsp. japonica TaxID=39947 RepID=A0A0N7KT43_ORYSJ|nr:Os11g0577675 [Oryza sativa Japonica Group]
MCGTTVRPELGNFLASTFSRTWQYPFLKPPSDFQLGSKAISNNALISSSSSKYVQILLFLPLPRTMLELPRCSITAILEIQQKTNITIIHPLSKSVAKICPIIRCRNS